MQGAVPSVRLRRQALKYVVVAGLVTLGYLTLFSLGLALGWHYFVAILVAQAITIALAFPLYRTVVFDSTGGFLGDLGRFLAVWSAGAVAGLVLTPLLVEIVGVSPLIAQTSAIVVVALGSFLGHRLISFRDGGPHRVERPRNTL